MTADAADAGDAAEVVKAVEAAKTGELVEAGKAAKITEDTKYQPSLGSGGVVVEKLGLNKEAEKSKITKLTEGTETINYKAATSQPEAHKTPFQKRGKVQGTVAHVAVITKVLSFALGSVEEDREEKLRDPRETGT